MEKELEVKVLGIDIEDIEKKIISLGGKLIANEVQVNTLIDSKDRPIKSYLDAYLRIRQTKDILNNKDYIYLTLKKNINLEGIRENLELTTEISNKDMMIQILKDLGFDYNEVGHKKRKSYEFMDARIDLDTWDENTYPFPYMEIEVRDIKHLNEVIKYLEIPQENISTKSIVELRKELKLL
ncbi:class IV adenylate cyclase [Wansuia hejianensis]|uniref:Class IV adenylate cyclase n=1 Tax=Wansuia hejianensis TaxID=2763667 RepID=A0A926F3L3_9FIRM|nr:class IV adenylate cyclase [Wansuia hejianensis]MBC8591337.1 class IV adenylate cyclase [Wansuia hejianensis]